jgi:hypothetical protein
MTGSETLYFLHIAITDLSKNFTAITNLPCLNIHVLSQLNP